MKAELTVERVNELLLYDKDTGFFTRSVGRGGVAAGAVAGRLNSIGHRQISIDGRRYQAHRLAWLITHGSMPKEEIDHINGERDDNRIVNLREATRSENCRNRGAHANNKAGFKGVDWREDAQKWRAQIMRDGKKIHLGLFETAELAHAAYCAAAAELYGEFSNHGAKK